MAPALTTTRNLHAGTPGIEATLPFGRGMSRVYWDTPLNWDLSGVRSISFRFQIEDPSILTRATLYFRSGTGWYGGWFRPQETQWQTIHLDRHAFSPEGSPDGWHAITGARLSFWGASNENTVIRMAAFQTSTPSIALLLNADARQYAPTEFPMAQRLAERLQGWFRAYGIQSTLLTDDDLRRGPVPEGIRILILPYNPVITNGVSAALRTFTANGGKLIVAYSLSAPVATLLGLKGWQWMPADPPDAFTYLSFAKHATDKAFPVRIRQDSWNINKPVPSEAQILATWSNAGGQDSDIPAMTIGSNGVYLAHILTNIDRARKQQMLVAIMAKLAPALKGELATALRDQSVRLFSAPDWESTRSIIRHTARENGKGAQVSARLADLDQEVARLLATDISAPDVTFADWARAARTIQANIRATYAASLSARRAAPNEFRGVWAHQAEGIRGHTWQDIAAALQEAGMRQLFVNVLWGGAAYYPSDVLPAVAGNRDYLQEALTACRSHGLELHAWMVCWNLQQAPPAFIARMRTENRLVQDLDGQERPWLCPSHPENRRLTVRAAIELVERYPVDGVHLDYIRYPDVETCYCEGCATRFRATTGTAASNWPAAVVSGADRDAYLAWRREQISSIVANLYSSLKRANPDVAVSAAVWPGWPAIQDSIAQDWPAWARAGWIDFLLPMSYVQTPQEARVLFQNHQDILAGTVPFYPGIAPSTHNLAPEEVLRQIDALRRAGAGGFALFELDIDLLEGLLPAFQAGAMLP